MDAHGGDPDDHDLADSDLNAPDLNALDLSALDLSALDLSALTNRARAAQARAYTPYSGFDVGAALLCDDGTVVEGCNVENAAYPATICAERSAVASAVSAGHRRFRAIAVIGSGSGPTTPCGICRQVLFEFAPDLIVHAVGADGAHRTYRLGVDLLPDGFGPHRLRAGADEG